MKIEIEKALQPLIGLPLWGAGRAVDMEWLQFGERHSVAFRGGRKEVGDWAVHISCAWRIREATRNIVASSDLYMKADHLVDSTGKFNWDVQGDNRRDQETKAFLKDKENRLVVTKALADEVGGFTLELDQIFYLDVFPKNTAEGSEHWRLFQPNIPDKAHFVVTTLGIED